MRPGPQNRAPAEPTPRSVALEPGSIDFTQGLEVERGASFFYPGGLVAVHAAGRGREAIWDALQRKEIYGTSGPRILLWFDLLNPPRGRELAMGGETKMRVSPIFQARAVGSLEQLPGCPAYAEESLSSQRLERLCRGECYHPAERRPRITRLEVVRIRPQQSPDEDVAALIEDPWRVFECPADPAGCVATFVDSDFEAARRDAIYYVRAIEEPSPQVNADPLRCDRDAQGRCLAVNVCRGGPEEDCLDKEEERAWSSPTFVDYGEPGAARSAGASR